MQHISWASSEGQNRVLPSMRLKKRIYRTHLKDNMIYPPEALKNRIEGKVIIQFVVTKTGKVGKVEVVRSVNKELDQEAVRLIKMLPDFSPGRNAMGEPVNVWYILPVIFKLLDNN